MKLGDEWETPLEAVTEWAEALGMARLERDEWIRRAHDEGYSLREIADAAFLTHAGVKKIIERA